MFTSRSEEVSAVWSPKKEECPERRQGQEEEREWVVCSLAAK